MPITLSELCKLLDGELVGEGSLRLNGIAEIENARAGDITFVVDGKYARYLSSTKATAVIVSQEMNDLPLPAIKVADPNLAKAKTLAYFYPEKPFEPGIHPSAVIAESAAAGDGCSIGAGVSMGDGCIVGSNTRIYENAAIAENVRIGDDCIIGQNASILSECELGDRVVIGAGCVIGSDGFGFLPDGDSVFNVPQVGRVVIENDVRLGANCTVDRATMGVTVIRRGAKLDNLIQVAHNVEIGENTIIAAQTGIAGSTRIGKGVLIGGQVGVIGHINIGDGVKIAAQTGVSKSFPEGVTISGYPAREHSKAMFLDAQKKRVPKLVERVKHLEEELTDLKKRLAGNDGKPENDS